MKVKAFFYILITLIIIIFLVVYWFIPFNVIEFNAGPTNSNFTLSNLENQSLQYYQNMRFPNENISYRIYECSLQKQADMKRAFEMMQELTMLNFYPVEYGQEISVTCNEANQFEDEKGLFVAGEGGPTNVTLAGNFNVIYAGKILLIRNSDCEKPNVALHELLHVLGFSHSQNPDNIMYEITDCRQTIGEDMINLINEIYSVPSEPDLLFEDASAVMHGKYLEANFSVRNNGIKYSGESKIKILADGEEIKESELPPIEVGYGIKISQTIWVAQINVKKIEFVIENNFEELDKANNKVSLEIKK